MTIRDIVNEIRKIRERSRDSRNSDDFARVDARSYLDDLLTEFGHHYHASLANAHAWASWHAEVVAADEARLTGDAEADPHIRHALAESVAKHEALRERWQEETRRLVDLFYKLEEPFRAK